MGKNREMSGYNSMWLFTLFDLPMVTKEERQEYTHFRKKLMNEGFTRMQFSVYARFCESEEAAEAKRRRIRRIMPPDGQVRLMTITDRQFGKMEVFIGEKKKETEEAPQQMMLF